MTHDRDRRAVTVLLPRLSHAAPPAIHQSLGVIMMLGHACEKLTVMYLQRGPPIAENKPTMHRTHRTHRTTLYPVTVTVTVTVCTGRLWVGVSALSIREEKHGHGHGHGLCILATYRGGEYFIITKKNEPPISTLFHPASQRRPNTGHWYQNKKHTP